MMALPPAFILRDTRFPTGGGGAQAKDRIVFKDVGLRWLLATAYDHPENRCVLPTDLPEGKFDFMFTENGNFREALKAELQKRYNLVGRFESREGDALIIKVANPNAPGIKISSSKITLWNSNPGSSILKNQSIEPFLRWVERELKTPIHNQTGLTNRYDLTLKWDASAGPSRTDALKQALLDQLGLELTTTREPVQMLIIEKAK